MLIFNQLVGLPVLLVNGLYLGTVVNLGFSRRLDKLLSVRVFNEQTELSLPYCAFLHIGKDALIAKNVMRERGKNFASPVGKRVYTAKGEYLGRLTQIIGENNSVQFIETELAAFSNELVADYINEEVIVGQACKTRLSLPKWYLQSLNGFIKNDAPPLALASAPTPTARLAANNEAQAQTVFSAAKVETVNTAISGLNETQRDYKRVTRNVYDKHGNLLVAKGVRVSHEIIKRALRADRLIELTGALSVKAQP